MSYVERRRFLWILFLAGIALAAAVANSTTLARMSFDELAQKSSAVGRPRCQNSKNYWDGGELWTGTSFEVVERNKGSLGASVTVRMLGGRADGFTSRVDGVPAFRTGEEVYLFLWGKPGESYRVLGWSQGTFRIIRDARTRLRVLYPDASDTVHVGAIRGHILNDNPFHCQHHRLVLLACLGRMWWQLMPRAERLSAPQLEVGAVAIRAPRNSTAVTQSSGYRSAAVI
jgi:hypothetical protein